MLSRRRLLATGLALPGLLLAPAAVVAPRRNRAPRTPLVVLVDRRHAASRDFGAALAAAGARRVVCAGDVSVVWLEVLGPLVRAGTGTVAGLTSPAALHCLERLALARGLCVTRREPLPGGDPDWRHDASALASAPLVRWTIAPGLAS